jgi:Tfp pilus assembly protein PilV
MTKKLKSQIGDGMIETLVTLVILAIGALALIKFQAYLAYNNGVMRQQGEAMIIATKQLETLRNFLDLTSPSSYSPLYSNIANQTTTVAGTSANFTTIANVSTFASPTYKEIDLTISWTDRRNNVQTRTLSSQVAGIAPANEGGVM